MKKIITFVASLLITGLVNAAAPIAKHVVFIGLDGWAASTYNSAEIPFMKKLASEGAFSNEKRAVLESSSAINWASIFMGVGPEVHGYLKWGSKTPEMKQPNGVVTANGIFPTIFQIAKKQHPQSNIAVFYEWDGIKHLVDTLSLDTYGQYDDERLAAVASEYFRKDKPELTAIIFNSPDSEGHGIGWGSKEYLGMMNTIDGYISAIFDGLRNAGMIDDTVVIITADHGGQEKHHGGTSMDEVESPIIIWGKGIAPGKKITDMIVGYDVAPTIAHILGLETPQCWRGRPIKQAFEK